MVARAEQRANEWGQGEKWDQNARCEIHNESINRKRNKKERKADFLLPRESKL